MENQEIITLVGSRGSMSVDMGKILRGSNRPPDLQV